MCSKLWKIAKWFSLTLFLFVTPSLGSQDIPRPLLQLAFSKNLIRPMDIVLPLFHTLNCKRVLCFDKNLLSLPSSFYLTVIFLIYGLIHKLLKVLWLTMTVPSALSRSSVSLKNDMNDSFSQWQSVCSKKLRGDTRSVVEIKKEILDFVRGRTSEYEVPLQSLQKWCAHKFLDVTHYNFPSLTLKFPSLVVVVIYL